LLRLFARRGFALTAGERARVAECAEEETLDRWFDQALVAASVGEALA
jgi:hypothetical protein